MKIEICDICGTIIMDGECWCKIDDQLTPVQRLMDSNQDKMHIDEITRRSVRSIKRTSIGNGLHQPDCSVGEALKEKP